MNCDNQCCENHHTVQEDWYGINVTALAHHQEPLLVEEAAELVPDEKRKPGTRITFWTYDGWQTWQFIPMDVNEWTLPESWEQITTFGQEDIADLQNQIDSIREGGWAISQELGTSTKIGISQNALTGLIGFDNVSDTIRGRIKVAENKISSIENSRGVASGIATLDSNGKVPTTQLPYNPDEEDLTVTSSKIKLKDKAYNAASFSGLGRKILRKNIVNGKNVLTQAMLAEENTVYIIQYDYDLKGATITIPDNCVLKFEGGHISDSIGTGNLTLTNTFIEANGKELGILLCSIDGTYINSFVYPEWLVGSENDDFTNSIQSLIDCASNGVKIVFTNYEYNITPVINLRKNIHLYSQVGSTLKVNTTDYYRSIFIGDTGVDCDNITITGLVMRQTPDSYTTLSSNQVGRLCVCIYGSSNNIIIDKCIFEFNGTNAVSVNGTSIQNAIVKDCTFNFSRASVTSNPNYDSSSLYLATRYHYIIGNLFRSAGQNVTDWVDGACESHGVCGIITNNIFNKAKACINVTNEIPQEQGETYGRTISNNVGEYCNSFVRLWASISQPAMKNIIISSNCITNINQTAVVSVFAVDSVGGELSDILVEGNYFKGVFVEYDGTDITDNIPKQTNVSAIKIFSPDKIERFYIKDNIFDSWGCRILSVGYYRTNQTSVQEIWFKNNILRNCFNGEISHRYSSWDSFSLFIANHTVKLVIEDNTIDIPSTSTIPPLLLWVGNSSHVSFRNNRFINGVSALYTKDSTSSVDTDVEDGINRKPSLFVLGSESLSVVGDLRVEGNIFSKCTRAGTSNTSTLTNGKAIVNYRGVAFQCDEGSTLIVGDHFNYAVNGTSGSEAVIRAVVGNKFYTSAWRTLAVSASLTDGTEYSATFTLRPAVWVSISVEIAGTLPTSLPIGGTYFSTGLNRPIWKNSAGNPVDAFGHASKAFSGTTADRPTGASVGHLYFDTNLKKYICWNGSSWVNVDGTSLS